MQFILVHKHGRCDISLSLLSMHLGDVSEANHKLFRMNQNACVALKKEAQGPGKLAFTSRQQTCHKHVDQSYCKGMVMKPVRLLRYKFLLAFLHLTVHNVPYGKPISFNLLSRPIET